MIYIYIGDDEEFPMRSDAMPTIRISDKSWEKLKGWAEPLVDSADSALAKVLDAAERNRGDTSSPQEPEAPLRPSPSRSKHAKLPQREFREPLLQVIYELGGSAHVHDLRPVLRERIRSRLLPGDFEHVSGGAERWWNAACWERHDLVIEGYFRDDSPRGVWALSEKGIALVESRKVETTGNFVDHLRAMPDVGEDSDFER